MFRKCALVLGLVLLACGKEETTEITSTTPPVQPAAAAVPRPAPDAIAAQVPQQAGSVKTAANGPVGAPIVVIEENHVSQTGQLEAAIVLSRLHDQFALKHIVVEGYLRDEETIQRAGVWLRGSPLERARFAARLVGEGDIGGPEFAALVYTDTALDHGEASGEYKSGIMIGGDAALLLYLTQVALYSLDADGQAKAADYTQQLGADSQQDDSQKGANAFKLAEFVIALDPWCKEVWARYQGEQGSPLSIEDEIALVESVEARARAKNVAIPAEVTSALDKHMTFLRQRSAASDTIVASAARIADAPDVPIVAVEIGAGHSARVSALLQAQTRPFVLVSLNGLNDKTKLGKMTVRELERKYNLQPVSGGLLGSSLLGAYPVHTAAAPDASSGSNRPRLVLQQEWFKAKTELYASTDAIVAAAGGIVAAAGGGGDGQPPNGPVQPPAVPAGPGGGDGPGPPTPGGWLPLPMMPGDPTRHDLESNQFVHIDPGTIEYLRAQGKPTEVLFSVVIGSDANRKTLWVKAGHVQDLNPDSGKTVEEVLEHELSRVKAEDSSHRDDEPVNENVARVQLSLDTKAVFATSREEAINTEIRY